MSVADLNTMLGIATTMRYERGGRDQVYSMPGHDDVTLPGSLQVGEVAKALSAAWDLPYTGQQANQRLAG